MTKILKNHQKLQFSKFLGAKTIGPMKKLQILKKSFKVRKFSLLNGGLSVGFQNDGKQAKLFKNDKNK